MKLPNDSIGISDLLDYRECPTRMELGMKRHESPQPGEVDWTTAYGSAVHDAIHLVEEGRSATDAVTEVWPLYNSHLDPEDLALLREDLDKYRGDSPLGMEVVASEIDAKVPLFWHEGRQIYFRFKLDYLARREDDHTVFYHRDYKSSKWRKTQQEVDKDLQMWAYNWAICELYPEARSLLQSYEQLRFGNLLTSKNDEQRRQMKDWLIEEVKALLADEQMKPKQNEWCRYCPLVLTCPETINAHKAWQARLAALAPMTKEGRRTRVALAEQGFELEMALRALPAIAQTRKHLEHVEKALKGVLEQMPSDERDRLGWRTTERRASYLPPAALRELHRQMGDSFYEATTVSKTAMEKIAGKSEVELMNQLSLDRVTSTSVTQTP